MSEDHGWKWFADPYREPDSDQQPDSGAGQHGDLPRWVTTTTDESLLSTRSPI